MNIVTVNSEVKLTQIASCIGRFPQIWGGWMAARIMFDNTNLETHGGIHHATKAITESYLVGIEGRVFQCENSIHILCKNVSTQIINHAGKQICALLSDENNGAVDYTVFDLDNQADEYARLADQDSNNILLYSSTARFLDRYPSDQFKVMDNKTRQDLKNLTRVLLVEDDPVTRWMVRNSLKNACEFASATCANSAYSMYSSFHPELVFLDINLPDNNGYNVLQWIMRNDPGAYVVMFSSQNSLDDILEALEKGARGFIGKPFLQENLLSYVQKV